MEAEAAKVEAEVAAVFSAAALAALIRRLAFGFFKPASTRPKGKQNNTAPNIQLHA